MPLTVPSTVTYSDNDLRDILTTALEGGIGYWSHIIDYGLVYEPVFGAFNTEQHPVGWLFAAIEHYGDDDSIVEVLVVDAYIVALGMLRIADPCFKGVGNGHRKAILSGDAGDIDADVADCIVQAGLFGEIIYG